MNFREVNDIQKQRIFHHVLAIIGTVFVTIISLLLHHYGYLNLAYDTLILLLVIFGIGNLSFTLIFFTKINDRIKSEELVLPHMMWGQTGLLVLAYYAPTMHQVSMMLSLTTFVFVAFGFSSTRLFLTVIIVVFGHGYVLLNQALDQPAPEQWLILATFTISAIFIAAINSYFGNLRVYLGDQNALIQIRTGELEVAQEQLTQAKEQAEAAAESKTRFLAAASHDLRQPLHALELYIDTLVEQGSDSDSSNLDRQHIFTQMLRSARELGELLNSLFDISRLDANIVDVDLTPVELYEIVSDLEWEFKELSDSTRRPLKVRRTRAVVNSDPIMLRRVIRGLVANALKHSLKGRVLIGFRSKGDFIRCQVWDSGQGIPEAEQEKIFEEFYQIKNSNRDRQQGLGLGLALIKRICSALNHDIGMRSNPGRGSVFWFDMQKANPIQLGELTERSSFELSPLRGKTVVCIDDELCILEGMGRLLDKWECTAVLATSADQALKLVQDSSLVPDIIVSDYRLADHFDGLEAIKFLQNRLQRFVPAILVTGDIDPSIAVRAQAVKIKLLQKPVTPAKLQLHIANTLKSLSR